MLSVVAVSNRERAGGLMAEQNEIITGGMCRSSAVAVGEPTPWEPAPRHWGSAVAFGAASRDDALLIFIASCCFHVLP